MVTVGMSYCIPELPGHLPRRTVRNIMRGAVPIAGEDDLLTDAQALMRPSEVDGCQSWTVKAARPGCCLSMFLLPDSFRPVRGESLCCQRGSASSTSLLGLF